jgi:murein L,D-transpeptidase YafK
MRLKLSTSFFGIVFLALAFTLPPDFLGEQKKYERVRDAITGKQSVLEKKLSDKNLSINNFNLLLIAYKDENKLEVYAKKKTETTYSLIQSYDVCASSGELGPKRKYGDLQVPEGFYHIDRFNPTSSYHLSLGINYPNQSDRKKSKASNLGGDIFIHGSCVTIGCLPMTDDKIKEIYLLAVHAKNNGQTKIPVYIFPFRMTDKNMSSYKSKYKENKELLLFWENIQSGYEKFSSNSKALQVSISENGDYVF